MISEPQAQWIEAYDVIDVRKRKEAVGRISARVNLRGAAAAASLISPSLRCSTKVSVYLYPLIRSSICQCVLLSLHLDRFSRRGGVPLGGTPGQCVWRGRRRVFPEDCAGLEASPPRPPSRRDVATGTGVCSGARSQGCCVVPRDEVLLWS